METELVCSVSGTSDVGLQMRMCLEVGLASLGTRWVRDVKAMPPEAVQHCAAALPAAGVQGHGPEHVTTACCAASGLGKQAVQDKASGSTVQTVDDADAVRDGNPSLFALQKPCKSAPTDAPLCCFKLVRRISSYGALLLRREAGCPVRAVTLQSGPWHAC